MSLENKLDQAKGAVKEGVGKVTGDNKTEAEGFVEKTVAKAKEVAEDAKEAVEGTVEGIKKNLDKQSYLKKEMKNHLFFCYLVKLSFIKLASR